ncbi:MAG: hypothetical protein HND55_10840 [Pseudomonadota bacterium]|nr:MAG: hypothetical protein HND55_10840 [Pseudomonadota bacterium]
MRVSAHSWKHTRRVIFKADITLHAGRKPKDNPRFLVTNINGAARRIYEQIYCARGDVGNRIKELKDGLAIDRTSCTSSVDCSRSAWLSLRRSSR